MSLEAPTLGADSFPAVTPEQTRRREMFVALQLSVALLAVAPSIYAMPRRLDLSFDSIQYLSAARNLLSGNGLSVFNGPGSVRPLTHFPPLYPVMLAVFGAIFGEVARGAWILNMVATVVTVLMVARLAERVAGGNGHAGTCAGVIAALSAAVANDLAVNATMLWSEPLFIVLVLATAGLLIRAVERESSAGRWGGRALVLAALAAGASALTRYAGIGFVGGGVFSLLLASGLSPWARVRRALAFGAISIAPLCAWLAYNELRARTATDRDLSVYVVTRNDLWIGLTTLARWVFPYDGTDIIRGVAALLIASLVAFILRETLKREGKAPRVETPTISAADTIGDSTTRRATAIVLILISTYGVFLLASIALVEHAASLDERLLSPALPLFIAMSIGAGCALLCTNVRRSAAEVMGRPRPYPRLGAAALLVLMLSLADQAVGLVSWSRHMPERSLGLTQLGRSANELLAVVRALPRGARVYSNMPYMVYAFADRVVSDLPRKMSETSLKSNPGFQSQLRQIAAAGNGGPTYLVFFDSPFHPPFYTTAIDAHFTFPSAEKHFFRGGEIVVVAGH